MVLVWVPLEEELREEGLGVVDMEHDPRQRGEGARRWRGGGGKPTLGCLRAAGRFSQWGLA